MSETKSKTIENSLEKAKESAAQDDWQTMYHHLWTVMENVPDDATVGWVYEQTFHEPTADGQKINQGFGGSSDPIDQIQSVLYENNDVGTDYIYIQPAGWDDE